MNRPTLRYLLLIAATLLAFPATAAHAQDTIVIESLLVRLWPEFDDASMLVILNGQTNVTSTDPVDLRIPISAGSRIHAVAWEDLATGSLNDAPYAMDGDVVVISSPNGSFHVEFYDPALDLVASPHTYTLNWTPEYAVTEVVIEAQQPVGATNFSLDPPGGLDFTDQFGLPGLRVIQPGPAAGQPLTVTVSYNKVGSSLSVDSLQSQSASQETAPGTAPAGNSSWIAYVLVGVGILFIGGGVFWYFRTMREDAPRAKPKPRRKPSGGAGGRFCTQCGQSVESGDQFCRHCGAKLRR